MPPAPAAEPKATAFMKLISNLKKLHERMLLTLLGKMADLKMLKEGAPEAFKAETALLSILLKLMLKAKNKYAVLCSEFPIIVATEPTPRQTEKSMTQIIVGMERTKEERIDII